MAKGKVTNKGEVSQSEDSAFERVKSASNQSPYKNKLRSASKSKAGKTGVKGFVKKAIEKLKKIPSPEDLEVRKMVNNMERYSTLRLYQDTSDSESLGGSTVDMHDAMKNSIREESFKLSQEAIESAIEKAINGKNHSLLDEGLGEVFSELSDFIYSYDGYGLLTGPEISKMQKECLENASRICRDTFTKTFSKKINEGNLDDAIFLLEAPYDDSVKNELLTANNLNSLIESFKGNPENEDLYHFTVTFAREFSAKDGYAYLKAEREDVFVKAMQVDFLDDVVRALLPGINYQNSGDISYYLNAAIECGNDFVTESILQQEDVDWQKVLDSSIELLHSGAVEEIISSGKASIYGKPDGYTHSPLEIAIQDDDDTLITPKLRKSNVIKKFIKQHHENRGAGISPKSAGPLLGREQGGCAIS